MRRASIKGRISAFFHRLVILSFSAVAADRDPLCPTRSGKDLLRSWLAGFRFPAIVTAEGLFLRLYRELDLAQDGSRFLHQLD